MSELKFFTIFQTCDPGRRALLKSEQIKEMYVNFLRVLLIRQFIMKINLISNILLFNTVL